MALSELRNSASNAMREGALILGTLASQVLESEAALLGSD